MRISEVKVGDVVKTRPDAPTEWEILEIDCHQVKVRENGTDYKATWFDICIFDHKV